MSIYLGDKEVGVTVIPSNYPDVSDTTATADGVATGLVFYDKNGNRTIGKLEVSHHGDRLQWKCDNMKSLYYEFYNYKGTDFSVLEGLDTSNVTLMNYAFYNCTSLKSINGLNTTNVTRFDYMFQKCSSLENIENIDMINCSICSYMFDGCTNIKNLKLYNIKKTLRIGYGSGGYPSYGCLLTIDSLIHTIKELWNLTGSTSETLNMSTVSKELIANVYVKLVDVTDEMLAQDQYAGNKKPCVVCESTDEGAMTLTEYATSKNWAIA